MESVADIMSWAQFFGLVLAPGMTLLVGYLTKASWPGKYKGVFLVVLSLVNGVLVEAFSPHPDGYDLKTAVLRAIIAFVTAQAAYTAVIGKTNTMSAVQNAGVKDAPMLEVKPYYKTE